MPFQTKAEVLIFHISFKDNHNKSCLFLFVWRLAIILLHGRFLCFYISMETVVQGALLWWEAIIDKLDTPFPQIYSMA